MGIVVKKVGMTRMVDDLGQMVPVTLLKVENQKVTKVLSPEKEGYSAVQIGYYVKPERKLVKPDITRLRKSSITDNYTRFKEFRLEKPSEQLVLGSALSLDLLEGVESIDITGLTKGRGYQGAIKRHGHSSGRQTHGSHFHRRPGSLGCRTTPGRVMKGKKMPGHMGTDSVTMLNLKVMNVDKEAQTLAIKGSVPGYNQGFLFVRPSNKSVIKSNKAAKNKA